MGLRFPAFLFTLTCGNLTVGHFRLQLHVAAITVGLRFEQRLPAPPFTNACGHEVLPGGMSEFSKKPPKKLLWKTDLKGPPTDLEKHLMKSISGILLNPFAEAARILELAFLADSGFRALAVVTA